MNIIISEHEREQIQNLVKYPEWKVAERVLLAYLEDMNRLDNIGDIAKIGVEAEVAGRVWVLRQLGKWLTNIGLLSQELVKKKDTSE